MRHQNLLNHYFYIVCAILIIILFFRICREGIEIKHKGKNIIENERSCKELNGKWKEDTCYLW